MKHIILNILLVVFLVISVVSNAKGLTVQTQLACDTNIADTLTLMIDEYNEVPILRANSMIVANGQQLQTTLVIFVSPDNSSVTTVQITKDGAGCIGNVGFNVVYNNAFIKNILNSNL
jgi:hypothetical protein